MLNVSVRTLDKWALHGTGPRFRKIGTRACRYDLADLEAFISNSPVGGGTPGCVA
jgi:hypothetical protein